MTNDTERIAVLVYRYDQAIKKLRNKYYSGIDDLVREVNERVDTLRGALLFNQDNRARWSQFERNTCRALCVIAAPDGTPYPGIESRLQWPINHDDSESLLDAAGEAEDPGYREVGALDHE